MALSFSRSATSTNWVAPKPVFIITSRSPALPAAAIVMSRPRWSRAITPITDPRSIPLASKAFAKLLDCLSKSP